MLAHPTPCPAHPELMCLVCTSCSTLSCQPPHLHVQVRAALRQASGCLQTARALCARLAAHQQALPAAAASPLRVSPAPAYSQRQRQWWPRSEFCSSRSSSSSSSDAKSLTAPARPSSSSSTSAASSFQRPRLVPHQVLPLPAQRSIPQQQQGMQPPGAAQQAVPAMSSSRQSPATVALRRLLGTPAAGAGPGAGGSAQQAGRPPAAGIAAATTSGSGGPAVAAPTPVPPTPAAGFPPVRPAQQPAQQAQPQQAEPPLHPHYAAVFLADKSRQQLLQHVPPLHEEVGAGKEALHTPSCAGCSLV